MQPIEPSTLTNDATQRISLRSPALQAEQTISENSSSPWTAIKEILETLILAVLLYFVIDAIFARVQVEQFSMEPTLFQKERLLVNKLAYKLAPPERGDIVVFHYPNNPSEDYIKRIVGLPGDTVQIIKGDVVVNGQVFAEPYIAERYPPDTLGSWQVPNDSIFVLGDNRMHSSDSQEWGFVPMGNVVGKAMLVYWPLERIGPVAGGYPISMIR